MASSLHFKVLGNWILLPLFGLLIGVPASQAQVSAGGTPPSFSRAVSGELPTVTLPAPDIQRFLAEDAAQPDLPLRFGAPIEVDLGMENSGAWSVLPDGARIWRLRVLSPGAMSLNIQYDQFRLAPGAEFFLYSDDQSQLIGAFTEFNSAIEGQFATQPLAGDAIVLEYHEPAWAAFPGVIHLSSVVHAYRNVFGFDTGDRNYGDSGSCNNNVNCPEGANWQDQKRAVAMILTSGGSRICSGSLVNNTSQDLRQYFLTANHCGLGTGSYIFMFNYESPTCTNANGPTTQSVQGCTLRATNTASDFTLVELTENIPSAYNVYFAGWSSVNTPSSSSVGIHHPAGDIKKISFDNQATTSDRYLGNSGVVDSHWKITQWDDGTTEGGSSGSPLFDQNHRVIGQLHGGYASCTSQTADWYGKFSMSWNYGGGSSNQLLNWLDPAGTNPGTLDGIYDSIPTIPSLSLAGVSVVDGNDGSLDPGETPSIVITLANAGANATGITGTLSETSPWITVTDANGGWPNINMGQSAASTNSFIITVLPGTPVGHVASFSLLVNAAGGYSTTLTFTLTSGLIIESFETGNFNAWPWTQGGNAPWTIVTDVVYAGTRAAKSGVISHNQNSSMTLSLQVGTASDLKFQYKVSSEPNYDYLRFSIDGVEQDAWAGTIDWTQATYTVAAGAHTFTWSYTKDGSVSTGSDCAWVDEIILPSVGTPAFPEIAVTPLLVNQTLAPGSIGTELITISNTGDANLTWSAATQTVSLAAALPFEKLGKGEADLRLGAFDRNAGGPDGFGYRWKDSNEAGGPVYSWVDITGPGTNLSTGDDTNQGPFNLGFTFNFYGTDYSAVRISSNGFLTFTSTSNQWTNQGIPNVAEPNNMIAPFWDDFNVTTAGMLKYYADAANQRFIVQWTAVPHYNTSNYETFQVILHADGRILTQYQTVTDGLGATVGTENAGGTDGLQVVANAAYLTSGLAVEIALESSWLSVAPASGNVGAGGNGTLTATLDATDLAVGTYQGSITINSNDADESSIVIPVTLIVGSADNQAPTISLTCLGDTYSDLARLVTATITDASGVASATLSYGINGGGVVHAAMAPAGGDTWTASIPGVSAPGFVDYYATAVDASPNQNSSTSSACAYTLLELGQPVAQIALLSSAQAQVSWTAVPGATQYNVYTAPAQGGVWSLAASTAGTSVVLPVAATDMQVIRVRAVY